jgi:predicted Zn-dependent peptidase
MTAGAGSGRDADVVEATRPAVPVSRSRLPEPEPPRAFTFPAVTRSTLTNGLRVWTVPHPQVPLVALMLLVSRGAASDPPGREGLAAITADMLDEGSGDRSAIEMHEALAAIGAQFDTDIGSDAMVASITVLSRFVDRALTLLADMVARPALRPGDFARVRQLRLHRLAQIRDMPGAVADRAFLRLLYGGHPYGHSSIGTEESLGAVSLDEVCAFHAAMIRPGAATLIAVGDCDHEAIARFASNAFGSWADGTVPDVAADTALPASGRINVVPRPRAPQSELRIGHVSAPRDTPDYHALLVANAVLGGQFVSRINLNLREDKGITYGARTAFEFRRLPGPFVMQVSVQTSATALAIEQAIQEIGGIRGPRPVTAEELRLGTAALTRGYARNFETADQIARAVMQLALYGLPDTYFAEFVPRVQHVTADEATAAMARHVDPARLITVIVGDMDVIGDGIARLGLGEPVVVPQGAF